ncbi:DUF6968 family protein [Bosea sp. (in: a-proteobacteria)]|jgi:hypothetical protein|uniref:DUF6968 family protein n=1 Tax=Bosea sp. (in: a-proteobacteria) TaxID=1871050 RepID=UPI003F729A8D
MAVLERLLTYASSEGDAQVRIVVESPQKGEVDWSCAYKIDWPGEARLGFGYGIDSTQAMLLALRAIGTDLYTSDYHRSGRLRWEKPGRGYGFPVPRTIRDLLIGEDAVEFG